MLNPLGEINWRPGATERRKFAASLMVGFPCVAAVLLVAGRWQDAEWHFGLPLRVGGIGLALGLVLWVVPQIARPFYVGWYAVAGSIGFVVGNTLLAAVYLLLFAPVGWARRTLGRSALSKGFDRSATTYWRDAPPPSGPERYYRQF